MKNLAGVTSALETVHRLRAPGGCPWDREQTHQSLRPFLIEEAFETVEQLDRSPPIDDLLVEELGDVLLQILLHSEIAAEAGRFTFDDVCAKLSAKLIRRHPHVFGDVTVDGTSGVLKNWELQKKKEKGEALSPLSASVLSGVPKGLPALQRAARVIDRVTRVGFQWPDLEGPLQKLREEVSELEAELKPFAKLADIPEAKKARIESEIGDVFFCLANLTSVLKLQPEDALRSNLRRFESRFQFIERHLAANGRELGKVPLEEMDHLWNQAKALEKLKKIGITGGIASGKSTVASMLKMKRFRVVDADQVSHEVSAPGGLAYDSLIKHFGTADRSALRDIVFKDPEARQKLEAILHPAIQTRSEQLFLQVIKEGAPVVFYEASLLIESRRHESLDALWVVDCEPRLQLTRLRQRNPDWSQPQIDGVLKAQLSREERLKYATQVIVNDGSASKLVSTVEAILSKEGLGTQ